MKRVAIIAAMPGELKPFLDANAKEGWTHERRGNVKLWRLIWSLDQGEWIAACAGAKEELEMETVRESGEVACAEPAAATTLTFAVQLVFSDG